MFVTVVFSLRLKYASYFMALLLHMLSCHYLFSVSFVITVSILKPILVSTFSLSLSCLDSHVCIQVRLLISFYVVCFTLEINDAKKS